MVGTKIDLRNLGTTQTTFSKTTYDRAYDGVVLATELGAVKYVECSALTKKGLKNVFNAAILAILFPKINSLSNQNNARHERCNIL